jgi:hypothetical protein
MSQNKVTSLSSTKAHGLKQVSLNWFKKLTQDLIDRGFHSSANDPCLYFKKGMIIITYVDDCIIVSDSMKNINAFVHSMKTVSKDILN